MRTLAALALVGVVAVVARPASASDDDRPCEPTCGAGETCLEGTCMVPAPPPVRQPQPAPAHLPQPYPYPPPYAYPAPYGYLSHTCVTTSAYGEDCSLPDGSADVFGVTFAVLL